MSCDIFEMHFGSIDFCCDVVVDANRRDGSFLLISFYCLQLLWYWCQNCRGKNLIGFYRGAILNTDWFTVSQRFWLPSFDTLASEVGGNNLLREQWSYPRGWQEGGRPKYVADLPSLVHLVGGLFDVCISYLTERGCLRFLSGFHALKKPSAAIRIEPALTHWFWEIQYWNN